MTLRTSLATALAAIALFCASIGRSQQPAPSAPEADSVPDSVADSGAAPVVYETATVVARELETSPRSVTVIDAELIESSGALDAAEIVARAPGAWSPSGALRGGQQAVTLRGGDPNSTQVLIDGVPLNDSTDSLGGAVSASSLLLWDLERVEVVRGGISAAFGSGGLAGAVHLLTRRETGRRVAAEVGVGHHDARSASAAFGWASDSRAGWAVQANALRWSESGRVADDDFDSLGGFLRSSRETERQGFRLWVRSTSSEVADYPEGGGGVRLGSGRVRRADSDLTSAGLSFERRFGSWSLDSRTTVLHSEVDRRSPAIGFVVPETVDATDYRDLRLQASVRRGGRLDWAFGAFAQRERGENDGLLLLRPLLGFDLPATYRADRRQSAAFVEAAHVSRSASVEAGLRVDRHDGGEEWSPRLSLGVSLSPGWRLVASYSESFKLPSLYALGSPASLGGNPELSPEQAGHSELGARWQHGRWSGELTGFSSSFRDLVDFDFESFRLVNRSEVLSEGIEAGLRWSRGPWNLSVAATRQDVVDRRTGEPLRLRPDFHASALCTWRSPRRWMLSTELRWIGDQVDQLAFAERPAPLEGTQLLAVVAQWRIDDSWSLRLRGTNVGDRDYETQLGLPGVGAEGRIAVRFIWPAER